MKITLFNVKEVNLLLREISFLTRSFLLMYIKFGTIFFIDWNETCQCTYVHMGTDRNTYILEDILGMLISRDVRMIGMGREAKRLHLAAR